MQVIYNGYELPKVIETQTLTKTYEKGSFRCVFLIEESSASSLVSECEEAERKLREPYKTLTTNFGGSSEYSFSHTNNTGMNTRPHLHMLQDEHQTETSRAYSFELDFMLPADLSGFAFRRTSVMNVTVDTVGATSVEFYLEYTASNSPVKGSRDNFIDNGIPFTLAKLSSTFSGLVFERVSLFSTTDDQDKLTTGKIVYQELLERQSKDSFDDSIVKNLAITYSLSTPKTVNLTQTLDLESDIMTKLHIVFSTKVDKNESSASGLESVYRDKIKPLVLERCKDILQLNSQPFGDFGSIFLDSEDVSINPYTFTVNGSITASIPKSKTSILKIHETLTTVTDTGVLYAKLYDGIQNTYSVWGYGGQVIIIRNVVIRQLGDLTLNTLPVLKGSLILKNTEMSISANKVGIDASGVSNELTIHDIHVREHYLLVDDRPASLGSSAVPEVPPSSRGAESTAGASREAVNPKKTFQGTVPRSELGDTRIPTRGA